MRTFLIVFCALMLGIFLTVTEVMARNSIFTGGLSLSYDYQDRSGDDSTLALDFNANDYSRLVLTPLLRYVSSSQRDSFELSFSPELSRDLDDSETDWKNNVFVLANRDLGKAWQVYGSNQFLRSDTAAAANNPNAGVTVANQGQQAVAPPLSPNQGRRRYYRNTLNLGTDYNYRFDSLFRTDFSWILFRNDDDDQAYTDYDRYSVGLRDEHRFTARWKGIVAVSAVRGDYEETTGQLSEDLYEYYATLGIENNSIARNPLTATYDFIASRYDEDLQVYQDIHQVLFNWRRDFSSNLYTNLGGGPSYEKTEGIDGTWGYNAIAEVNHQLRRGNYIFLAEKRFDVDNFGGGGQRGFIDYWNFLFTYNHSLTSNLILDTRLQYRTEERTDPIAGTQDVQEDRYVAGIGLTYSFWRYYAASVNYTYLSQDSDIPADEYDDHRIVLTLSWQRDLYRW